MKSVLLPSMIARALAMVVTSLSSFITIRLILDGSGVDTFAFYSLLIGIPALLPFADLGVGAALVNRVAESSDVRNDPVLRGTLISAIRISCVAALLIIVLSILFYSLNLWLVLFGEIVSRPYGALVASICLSIFGASIPLSLGLRILLGLGKNHAVVAIQGAQGPVSLAIVFLISINPEINPNFYAIAVFFASFSVAVISFLVVFKKIGPALNGSVFDAFKRHALTQRIMDVGWPMFIQMAALPIGLQSARVVLSHTSSSLELAKFGAAATVYGALASLVSAMGTALWPYFAKARLEGRRTRPGSASLYFTIGASLACFLIYIVSVPLFAILSHGHIKISILVLLTFSLQTVAQAALYPLGMFLTDPRGFRFQIVPVLLMTSASILLSVWLTPRIGAAGPPFAAGLAICLFQLIPYSFAVRSRLKTTIRDLAVLAK